MNKSRHKSMFAILRTGSRISCCSLVFLWVSCAVCTSVTHPCTCMEQMLISGIFLDCSPRYFLRLGLSLNVELTHWPDWLSIKPQKVWFHCPVLHHGHLFSRGTRDSNSGPDDVLTEHLPRAICSFLFMDKSHVFNFLGLLTWEDFIFFKVYWNRVW